MYLKVCFSQLHMLVMFFLFYPPFVGQGSIDIFNCLYSTFIYMCSVTWLPFWIFELTYLTLILGRRRRANHGRLMGFEGPYWRRYIYFCLESSVLICRLLFWSVMFPFSQNYHQFCKRMWFTCIMLLRGKWYGMLHIFC